MGVRFIVGVAGHAVVSGWTVEFRKKQRLPLAVVKRAREQHSQTLKLMAIGRSALVGAKASRLKRKFPILHLFLRPSDDVDDREKSVRAIEGRTGPAHNLYSFDHVHVHQKLISQHRLPKNVIVDAMAVDQYQNPAVPISQPSKAAYANEGVIAVVGDVEAGHTAQDVGEVTIAVLLDLVRSDDSDRSRRLTGALHMLRSAINLNVGQFFQAGFTQ